MSKIVIEIESVQSGQPRPYADSLYEAYITMRSEGMLMDGAKFYYDINEDTAKYLARKFVAGWSNPVTCWADHRLETCRPVGPTEAMKKEVHPKWAPKEGSRWHILVRAPYTD